MDGCNAEHNRRVEELQRALIKKANNGSFSLKGSHSNTVRANAYKKATVSINDFNHILSIDKAKKRIYVEPRVTMEQLVNATLPLGLVPPVLPEFKSITVGGAINGAALESSSHRYGQLNDCCIEYEILCADGSIITANAETNRDLFYGISGAYGTLGIITAVEMELIPIKPQLLLQFHYFPSIEDAVSYMTDLSTADDSPEFLEALIFDQYRVAVVVADPIDHTDIPPNCERLRLDRWYSPWYYQLLEKKIKQKDSFAVMKTEDYLFRHDRAGFWMGGYALHPMLLFRYTLELTTGCPQFLDRLLMPKETNAYCEMRTPSAWFRRLFGWMMNSKRLYAFMHHGTEKWFAENFVIQDYYVPAEQTAEFASYVFSRYAIVPIWLCPMKPSETPQLFSPHYVADNKTRLLFDVGVYGKAKNCASGAIASADLDRLVLSRRGKKMLYSYSYYTPDEFWSVYDQQAYRQLRQKYLADEYLLDITEKVLQ